jgi:hypothetical protein
VKIGKIGITEAFETWKEGVPYACRRGDIERTAGLTVEEGISAKSQLEGGTHTPQSQDAISRARGSAPASEADGGGR